MVMIDLDGVRSVNYKGTGGSDSDLSLVIDYNDGWTLQYEGWSNTWSLFNGIYDINCTDFSDDEVSFEIALKHMQIRAEKARSAWKVMMVNMSVSFLGKFGHILTSCSDMDESDEY